jgi:tetratricopeptide (TPR) repeat protein
MPLGPDVWTLLGTQSRIWALQFWQILWPWNLSAHYSPEALADITLPLSIAISGVTAVLVGLLLRSNRLAVLGVAFFVLCLLPASNFAAQYHPIADRYLYVPLAGLGVIAAALVHRLRIEYPRSFAGGALLAVLFLLLSLEYGANLQRQKVWQTPAALWTDVLRQYPNLAQAHIGMANAHYRAGDYAAALVSAQEAVRTSSGYWADPYAVRAVCEWKSGKNQEALASFARARNLSRAYESKASMRAALFLSPGQLATVREMLSAERGVFPTGE